MSVYRDNAKLQVGGDELPRLIDKLFPKESPLRLLKEHADLVLKASSYLPEALELYFEGDLKKITVMSKEVEELERQADDIKARIRASYMKLKFVYFEKSDLMTILHKADSVIDGVDDVLKILQMNSVEGLEKTDIPKNFISLGEDSFKSVQLMHDLIKTLLDIVESSFAPKEIGKEVKEIDELENYEFDTDVRSVELGKMLYAQKNRMNPVDILYLEKLTTTISDIADSAENVAEAILMVIKS
ncbi:MAG: uncharacterized protein PWQ27_519 [Kosmotoga sp.]|nr:uncharacterized protein [Kosmotoga sp.]MDK2953136.1 uncharacterized protein [Kosmotoga sp.]